jgi:hypothetical protein
VEQEDAAIARQQRRKQVSAATNRHATIEELLEVVFSLWCMQRLYSEDQQEKLVSRRSGSVVCICELQVRNGSLWLAMRNLHC